MNMYQVVDCKSGLVFAEFSDPKKAHAMQADLEWAHVQLVQRPRGTPDSYRGIEAYSDRDLPDLDFDLSDEDTKVESPLGRRKSWRDWVLRSSRTPEVRAYEFALEG